MTARGALTRLNDIATAQLLFEEQFEDGDLQGRGWYDPIPSFGAFSGAIAGGELAHTWAQDAQYPAFVGIRHLFTATESLYVAYTERKSAGWVGSGGAFEPHQFFLLTTEEENNATAPAVSRLTGYLEHVHAAGQGHVPRVWFQDGDNIRAAGGGLPDDSGDVPVDLVGTTEDRAACGCNGEQDGISTTCFPWVESPFVANNSKVLAAGSAYVSEGDTDEHRMEAFVRMNSIVGGVAVADGIVRQWVDDVLTIEHTGVVLRTGARPNQRWNQLMIGPFIGAGSPVAQSWWLSDLVVATGRLVA